MEKQELYTILENMSAQLGADVLLENMAMAMSYDDLKENLEYIDRMHDLENFQHHCRKWLGGSIPSYGFNHIKIMEDNKNENYELTKATYRNN